MKYFFLALVYVAFYSAIAVSVYITESAVPLWALLLTPSYKPTSAGES